MRLIVSTHSRLKAAGRNPRPSTDRSQSFNTQPPEGGWITPIIDTPKDSEVSTHSRLKAAGKKSLYYDKFDLFQHTAA